MADDFISSLFGPNGVAIGAVAAAVALWRRHLKDDEERQTQRDANLAHERGRTAAAEERLDRLGPILKGATDVMEKSVQTTGRVVELLNSRGETISPFGAPPDSPTDPRKP